MRVVVLEEATAELHAAAEWYEHERVFLGDQLLAEVARVLAAIAKSPTTWPLAPRNKVVRRFVFTRFPYVAYFVVRMVNDARRQSDSRRSDRHQVDICNGIARS